MDYDIAVERFEKLVSDYGHVIRSAVRSVAGTAAERWLADVEQQVLLELWKQTRREQTIDHPSSYLYRAAVRETIRLVRKAARSPEESLEKVSPEDPRPESRPEQRALAGELGAKLRQITSGLSEDRRRAVIAHLAGYRVQEIMKSQRWSYNRARNLIARGMADLRRALEKIDES